MAFQEIDTSNFPVSGIKRGAPTVSIRENGQIALSAASAEVLKNCKLVYIRIDKENRIVAAQGVNEPPKGKDKSCLNLAWPKKGTGVTFSFLGALRLHFADYKLVESGNQVLAPEAVKLNAEKKLVQFSVPQGVLPKREVKQRKPRTKKVAEVPAVAAVKADTVDDDLAV